MSSFKEGLSPSLLLRAAGRNQPVAAGKKCSMILLQAVVSLAFSVLQGVRLCCSEPQVLCSPSGSTSVHLEVRLGPAEPCKVSWGGKEGGQTGDFLECWLRWKSCFWSCGVQQEALFVKASPKTQLLMPGLGLSSETPQAWNLQVNVESSSCCDS